MENCKQKNFDFKSNKLSSWTVCFLFCTDHLSSSMPSGNKSQIHYISIPIDRENSDNNNNDNSNNYYPNSVNIPPNERTAILSGSNNPQLRSTRRKSILDAPIGSFKGPNSLSKFATSLRRANSFRHIEIDTNTERSFFNETNDETVDPSTMAPTHIGRKLSLMINNPNIISNNPLNMRPNLTNFENPFMDDNDYNSIYSNNNNNNSNDEIVSNPRNPLIRSSISMAELTNNLAIDGFDGDIAPDQDSINLIQLEGKDGKVITVLAGQSTGPQTIFNSINVLIGIGLLALPLGLKYAGWILGLSLLSLFAFATFCTAELLSRCLDTDPTLMSYADLGYAAFGTKGRTLISALFTIDLMGCGVSLIILFGDSLNALFPHYSVNFFKILAFFVVTPPVFLPLSILSNISLMGIASTIGTVLIITCCGVWKQNSPGSLIEFAETHYWPTSFKDFCLSIGLLSACWGGHAVFPNLKTDMRHPHKFKDCLYKTYKITSVTDIGTAVIGFLMFGDQVKDEITKNVLLLEGYPTFIYGLISALMTMIPIAKTPLNARPIISVLDVLFNVQSAETKFKGQHLKMAKIIQKINCLIVNALFVIVAIICPQFDRLIAFLGAGLCFFICLILPCTFYMIICKDTIKMWEKYACMVTIAISIVLSTLGIGAAIMA